MVEHQASWSSVSWSSAAQATLHCLTGCAIGEVLGMVIGTALGLHNAATVVLVLSEESLRLFDTTLPGGAAGSAGLWVQTVAVAVAAVAGAVTTVQRHRGV